MNVDKEDSDARNKLVEESGYGLQLMRSEF